MEGADALRDMAYFPATLALGLMALEAGSQGIVQQAWLANALRPELDFASPVLAVLLIGALGIGFAFAWRSSTARDVRVMEAGVARGGNSGLKGYQNWLQLCSTLIITGSKIRKGRNHERTECLWN